MRRTLLVAALALLAACDSGTRSAATVEEAWIRLPAVAGRPAAGYAQVTVTEDRGALVSVSSPRARRVEMHETMASGAMTGMRPVAAIRESRIVFAPGGRHLMLFGLDPKLEPGAEAELLFRFERGAPVRAPARVVAAGDEPHH